MNLAETYVYKVYREQSFSKAAKKMYISQSSLSLTVQKLEKNLGFIIFNRSTSPITLTREGKIYIEYLEEIIEQEKNMHRRIHSASHPTDETIAIGNAFFISRFLLPDACSKFHKAYPNVEVKINMGETIFYSDLFEMLDKGTLDMLIGIRFDKKNYTGIPLMQEKYIIALNREYPGADALKPYACTYEEILTGNIPPGKIIYDYSLFKNIEFLKINSSGIIWEDMANFLMHCSLSPYNISSCRNIDIIYDMMLSGLGAAITTDAVISYHSPNEDVLYFVVDTPRPTCQSYIIYKNDLLLSESMQGFISALRETADEMKKRPVV